MIDDVHFIAMNKPRQVAHLILDHIVESNLGQGSSLGTEAELLERFRVSRPTLREGLRILESQGILTVRPGPNGGIIVARPSVESLAYSLAVLMRINNIPFSEVLSARMAIEPALVRDAARSGTEADFQAMEATIQALEAAGDNSQIVYRENRAFHNVIAKAAHNPVLEVFWLIIRILASGEGAGLKYSAENRKHIIESHRRILDALRDRNPDAAEDQISEHLGELNQLLQRRHRDELKSPARIPFGSKVDSSSH